MSGGAWLALETATDLASVAVGGGTTVLAEAEVRGARQHARMLLPLVSDVLRAAGLRVGQLGGVILADGPGSFTGLRVGASVAQALARATGVPVVAIPSLMARAWAGRGDGTRPVLAVSDALRGQVYAACYRFGDGAATLLAPRVRLPGELAGLVPGPVRLVGEAPDPVRAELEAWAGPMAGPPEGAPHARHLLALAGLGAGVPVPMDGRWEPEYGRPAEAQAKWEAAHGRPLPDPAGRLG